MTISTTNITKSYSGNGSTHSFAYDFPIFADADLTVIVRASTGAETTKTLNTHFIVTGAGASSGGNVLFKYNTGTSSDAHYSATDYRPATGETVVIRSELSNTQTLDLVANDPFPASSFEVALDRLVRMVQQHDEELDRSIKLSRTNTMTSTEFTTSATDRASKILAFDSSGEISVAQELGTFKGNSATTTTAAFVQRDIVKSTTTAQLNNIYICVADSAIGDLLTDTDHWALLVDAVSAASSATAAASSATAAASSASTASTQASNASTSASTASTQATNAANSATASASSATAASNAQAAAETALDTFDDRFLGAKSSDPSVDNDGAALIDGALYFDTTNDIMKVYDLTNTQWRQLTLTSTNQTNVNTVAGQISPTNNVATVATSINSGAFSGATTFAETYRVSANAPTTSLDIGDLWFDTTNNLMKVYGASGFISAGSSVNGTANRFAWTVGTSSGSYDGSLTVFPATYDAGFVDVFLNGVKLLVGTDVTATNGTSVTLASAAVAADIVEIVAYGTFTAATELSLLDNKKISLGTGQDLELTWDGTDGHISVAGTLNIDGSGETLAKFIDDGAVELYHNNAKKIETTAAGVDVTGTLVSDGLTVSGDAVFEPDNDGVRITGTNYATLRLEENDTTDLNTTMFNSGGKFSIFTSSDDRSSGTERLTLDHSNGRLGIGDTSPDALLSIKGDSDAATTPTIRLKDGTDAREAWITNESGDLSLNSGGSDDAYHSKILIADGNLVAFHTSGAEKARFDSSGNFLVATTSQILGSTGVSGVQVGASFVSIGKTQTTTGTMMTFNNGNGQVGAITTAGSSTSYSTSSDYRLKTAVEYDWDATTRLKQLKPARFKWIADGDDAVEVDGFLAHEAATVCPESVTGTKDQVEVWKDGEELPDGVSVGDNKLNEDGNTIPVMQGIDQAKLVPLLCKTILELEARITALEATE